MVNADAYPDLVFEGEVTFLGALASERFEGESGEKYFQITVTVKGENSKLRPGMTARVSITTDHVRNALSVPIQSVFRERGATYCYQIEGNEFRKVKVSTGRQNEDMVEILSGLQRGDQVTLTRPALPLN